MNRIGFAIRFDPYLKAVGHPIILTHKIIISMLKFPAAGYDDPEALTAGSTGPKLF
jgi:hypothetical protein